MAEVSIGIKAKDQFSGMLSKAGRAVRGLAGAVRSTFSALWTATKWVAGGIATIGAAAAVTVRAYMTQQDAVEGLTAALRNQGDKVDELMPQYLAFAAAIQKVTKYDDDLIISTMALGRNMGIEAKDLEASTKAAIGLAAAYKMDLETAMKLVAKSEGGMSDQLKRYGIVLNDTMSDEQKHQAVLAIGARNYKLAEAQAQTLAGRLAQLKNAFNSTLEVIGETVSKVFDLPTLFANARDALVRFSESGQIEKWGEKVKAVYEDVKVLVRAFAAGGEQRAVVIEGMKNVGSIMASRFAATIAKYGPVIGEAIANGFKAAIASPFKRLGEQNAAIQQLTDEGKLSKWRRWTAGNMALGNPDILQRTQEIHGLNLRAQGMESAAAISEYGGKSITDLLDQMVKQTEAIESLKDPGG